MIILFEDIKAKPFVLKHPPCFSSVSNYLKGLSRNSLNPGVGDLQVSVGIQEDLNGAWRLRAVLQNLEETPQGGERHRNHNTII